MAYKVLAQYTNGKEKLIGEPFERKDSAEIFKEWLEKEPHRILHIENCENASLKRLVIQTSTPKETILMGCESVQKRIAPH